MGSLDTSPSPAQPVISDAGQPIVERVAGWSAQHRKTAVFGWLLLVAAALMIGQRLGTGTSGRSTPSSAEAASASVRWSMWSR